MDRGGLFVGVLRLDVHQEEDRRSISAELEGSYGLFSASVAARFDEVRRKYRSDALVSMHHEGGPVNLKITDPTVPSQDVLVLCAKQRNRILDAVNLLDFILSHAGSYDWTGDPAATTEALAAALTGFQLDLDLVAECASLAIDHPAQASTPAAFAAARGHPAQASTPAAFAAARGVTYPAGVMPVLPEGLAIGESADGLVVPHFVGMWAWDFNSLFHTQALLLHSVDEVISGWEDRAPVRTISRETLQFLKWGEEKKIDFSIRTNWYDEPVAFESSRTYVSQQFPVAGTPFAHGVEITLTWLQSG